jgi:hypothetical protein
MATALSSFYGLPPTDSSYYGGPTDEERAILWVAFRPITELTVGSEWKGPAGSMDASHG